MRATGCTIDSSRRVSRATISRSLVDFRPCSLVRLNVEFTTVDWYAPSLRIAANSQMYHQFRDAKSNNDSKFNRNIHNRDNDSLNSLLKILEQKIVIIYEILFARRCFYKNVTLVPSQFACIIMLFRVIYSLFAILDSVIFPLDKFPDNGTSVRFTAHRVHLSRDTRKTCFKVCCGLHIFILVTLRRLALASHVFVPGKEHVVDLDAVNL